MHHTTLFILALGIAIISALDMLVCKGKKRLRMVAV